MKITKKLREDAALICAVAASNEYYHCAYEATGAELRLSDSAVRLALQAWRAFSDTDGVRRMEWHLVDGEVEAMLRTGWTP